MTTIIEALAEYLASYSGLAEGAPLWVNHLGSRPEDTEYAIVPLPGEKVLEVDILDRKTCEFPFAFRSAESTMENLARLQNISFYELLSEWFDSQSVAGVLPVLGAKKTAIKIEALTWGYLFEENESGKGVYQINCRLVYEQVP